MSNEKGSGGSFTIKDGGVYEGRHEPIRHERFSVAATTVARIYVEEAVYGRADNQPQYQLKDLVRKTKLSVDEVKDAVHELRHFVRNTAFGLIMAEATLFAEFDHLFKPWNPSEDAVELAEAMLRENFPTTPAAAAEALGWEPRRMNPAIVYLHERGAIRKWDGAWDPKFVTFRLTAGDETRRFLKSVKL